jgi:hypothetical protein
VTLIGRLLLLPSVCALAAGATLVLPACFNDDSVGPGDADAQNPADASLDATGEGGDDAPLCPPYASDANLVAPKTTYSAGVSALFQHSCAIGGATCHGDPTVATVIFPARPFLGYPDGGPDAAIIIQGIVGVPSSEDPAMVTVTAGDPVHSFLMRKLDGDQCALSLDCAKGDSGYTMCGVSMPSLNPVLDQPTRDAVRRWIAQGAKNN